MIFLGCLFEKEKEAELLKNSRSVSNAANTFQWNLINGLKENLSEALDLITVLPVGTFPKHYKKLFLKGQKISHDFGTNTVIGSINLPILKQNARYFKIKKLLKKTNDKNVIVYSAYLPFLKAIKKLDKSFCVTLIVTDLPEYYDYQKTGFLRKILRKINNRSVYKCIKRVDKFVLLTEQMKKPLNVGNRPYTVVEGISKSDLPSKTLSDFSTDERSLLYTGTLNEVFGIKDLVKAFMRTTNADYRLFVCGSGDSEEYVKSAAESDDRIKFLGFVPKEKIYELQKRATVLVNPRKNDKEFTKYSFPSKTMEYMASGTPVLMFKLAGIPDEYDEYIYYFNGNSIEDITESIEKVLNKPVKELYEFGKRAEKFVKTEKSETVQAKKIVDLINGNR